MPPRSPAGRAAQPRVTGGTPQARSRKVKIPIRLQDNTALDVAAMGGAPPHAFLSAMHADTLLASPVRGDLIVANAGALWARKAKGAIGTAFIMGADDPAWSAIPTQTSLLLSAVHTDTTPAAAVRGDLIVAQGVSPLWARFPKGALNTVLTMGADEPAWAAIPTQTSALLSAVHTDTTPAACVRGDVITGQGGTPVWTRLALGGPTTFLHATATDVVWATISSADLVDVANVAFVNASNTFQLPQQITYAGSNWLWLKTTTNNIVQVALQRDEGGGSYNVTWNAHVPASSTDFRIQGAGSDWLILTAAGALSGPVSAIIPTLYGSASANGDLTLEGTSHATKTTSYVILQPSGGSVVIGGTVPYSLLDARGIISGFLVDSGVGTVGAGVVLSHYSLTHSNQTGAGLFSLRDVGDSNYHGLAFKIHNTATATDPSVIAAVISSSGYFGIGTPTPGYKAHIALGSATNVDLLALENTDITSNVTRRLTQLFIGRDTVGNQKTIGTIYALVDQINANDGSLHFGARGSNTLDEEVLVIRRTGIEWGAGPAIPSSRFYIFHSAALANGGTTTRQLSLGAGNTILITVGGQLEGVGNYNGAYLATTTGGIALVTTIAAIASFSVTISTAGLVTFTNNMGNTFTFMAQVLSW